MTEIESMDAFEDGLAALERALGGATALTGAFETSLQRMQATALDAGRDVAILEGGIGRGLRRAFDGLVFDGMKLSDALRSVARSMVDAAYSAAMRPVTSHVGGLLAEGVAGMMSSLLPFANGAPFSQGRVMPFADGGVVSAPVRFPMRGGTGLMGEAGPEAIMPLARGADGRLGVQMQGQAGRATQVVMNISTPDAEGFRRGRSQIAGELSRALDRARRTR